MQTVNNFEHVLIHYKRTKDGTPKGVVVAIGAGKLGWSLCKSPDVFNKKKGLSIALDRAVKASQMILFDRLAFYEKCPFTLEEEFFKMKSRSFQYFKLPDGITDPDYFPDAL